jgi:hypothetical protein
MKINKKGVDTQLLIALSSIGLFVIMLLAILSNVRSCTTGRIADDSLEDIKDAITRIQRVEGAGEAIEVFIGPESMLIGYAPNHDVITTNYDEMSRYFEVNSLGKSTYKLGEQYSFPKIIIEDKDKYNEWMRGDIISFSPAMNYYGYVKQRATSCPPNSFCICECMNFQLETKELSTYSSENAHITCGTEKCVRVENVILEEKIYLKDFLGTLHPEYKDTEYYDYPRLHKMYWEGGFIIPRTREYDLGKQSRYICRIPGRVEIIPRRIGGVISDVTAIPIPNVYTEVPRYIDNCEDYEILLKEKRMLAGYTHNYLNDFFNLRIKNEGAGKISFELI